MKLFQKWLIAGIIALPVLIGMILFLRGNREREGANPFVSFKSIGLVQIKGTIVESDDYVRQIRSLRFDNSIAGVIVRIDSPGGAVAPSQEIYREMLRFRETSKPLVVSMGTVAASGGYYIASPGTKIFADPGTLTGSIGVIFTLPLFEELAKKVGIEFRVFTAGKMKDIGSPYRRMTEDEKKFIDELLKDTHEQFIDDVAAGRGMSRNSIARYADGRVFTGRQALSIHLIDTLGGYEDALDWLRKSTGLGKDANIVERKGTSSRLREWLRDETASLFPVLQLLRRSAGLYYIMNL
ncbi:MAG: signal peptide peptidase SppA [Chitinispirillaceae bacterium]|jgi:protease-4